MSSPEQLPSVSVVIPAYNAKATLGKTLDSVANQSLNDFEIVLVDDGSQDDTETFLLDWQKEHSNILNDRKIRVNYYRFENAGQGTARNRGIERSQGKYIAFLDADDQWSIDKLRAQKLFLDQHSEIALVYSWTHCVDEQQNFVRPGSQRSPGLLPGLELLMQNYLDNGSSPMVRRWVLEKVGHFAADLPPTEDWDLWLRIAERYPIAAIPMPQVNYRVSRYSSSANTRRLEQSARRTLERALDRQNNSQNLAALRSRSLANLYEYLYFQTFSGAIQRRNIPRAMVYLGQALRHDAKLRNHWGTVGRAIAKVICLSILPNRIAQKLLNRLGKANTVHGDLLGYINTGLDSI